MNEIEMYETYREDRIRQVKTTRERHPGHYAKAGVKGGKATAKTRDKAFYSMMGKKSAEARKLKKEKENEASTGI